MRWHRSFRRPRHVWGQLTERPLLARSDPAGTGRRSLSNPTTALLGLDLVSPMATLTPQDGEPCLQ